MSTYYVYPIKYLHRMFTVVSSFYFTEDFNISNHVICLFISDLLIYCLIFRSKLKLGAAVNINMLVKVK